MYCFYSRIYNTFIDSLKELFYFNKVNKYLTMISTQVFKRRQDFRERNKNICGYNLNDKIDNYKQMSFLLSDNVINKS